MAKKDAAATDTGKSSGLDRLPEALRDAGAKAAELAQNPIARSMLAAGLVTAAAALTSNSKVRSGVKQAALGAFDSADAAADSAGKVGAAIITAATEAVRRFMASGAVAAEPAASTSGKAAARSKPKRATAGAARKSSTKSKTAAAKPAKAKSAPAKPAKPSKAKSAPAKAAKPSRAAKSSSAKGSTAKAAKPSKAAKSSRAAKPRA